VLCYVPGCASPCPGGAVLHILEEHVVLAIVVQGAIGVVDLDATQHACSLHSQLLHHRAGRCNMMMHLSFTWLYVNTDADAAYELGFNAVAA